MNALITKNEVFVPGEDGNMIIAPAAIEKIRSIETERKQFDKDYKKFKKMLKEGMEEYGIKKLDNEDLLITYVEPTEKVVIDTAKLWAEYKHVALACEKESQVSSSVKITVR